MMTLGLILGLVAATSAFVVTLLQLFDARRALSRFGSITDLEQHKKKLEREQARAKESLQALQQAGKEAQRSLETLRRDFEQVEEAADLQSFGFYRPQYNFSSLGQYESRLADVRSRQKSMIKSGSAAECPTNWTVDGSVVKGRKMVSEQLKLMLRAFNGECDAAIVKVKYNNALSLRKRIEKSFDAINALGRSKQTAITRGYLSSKIEELNLVHEHRERVQADKEEQRRIKEQMREDQRAEEEIKRAQTEAEKEEARYQQALEEARKELLQSTGQQHERLEGLVNRLETELKEALDRKAKAIARAQLTKSGHVYVISNIGSFGESVFKIGMTRRLEPLERVKELGDASVPFFFDVHAMIYSENAPALEGALHKAFDHRRLNMVNCRKEFFRVGLDEIRQVVAAQHGVVTFVQVPEAEEFRKTVAMRSDSGTTSAAAA